MLLLRWKNREEIRLTRKLCCWMLCLKGSSRTWTLTKKRHVLFISVTVHASSPCVVEKMHPVPFKQRKSEDIQFYNSWVYDLFSLGGFFFSHLLVTIFVPLVRRRKNNFFIWFCFEVILLYFKTSWAGHLIYLKYLCIPLGKAGSWEVCKFLPLKLNFGSFFKVVL